MCFEDEACWNWMVMGNMLSGDGVLQYDGVVRNTYGNLIAY